MKRPWYATYPADYAAKTKHLSLEEHGAYRLLMDHYYETGLPIPNDPDVIKKILRVSRQKTRKIMLILVLFFREIDGKLYHERIEEELEKAKEIHKVKSDAANKRWGNEPPYSDADAYARLQPQSQSHSSTNKDLSNPVDSTQEKIPAMHYTAGRIVKLYHDMLPELIPIKRITPKLEQQIKFIHMLPKIGCHKLKHWEHFFARVQRSDWLTGRTRNEPSWYSLRGLLEIETYTRIAEGHYDNRK